MSNPFENPDASFLVLVNEENQHSLWPDFMEVPSGWESKYGPHARQECLSYIEEHWTDIRPRSVSV
ncbi:MbtH family protein [Streptomyces sp. NPDC004111]|uniref:MbtH family protein n=1 Tax=Streptomyces sp. NPDC004111 TaxID=3364690 RepID=UPI0036B2B620